MKKLVVPGLNLSALKTSTPAYTGPTVNAASLIKTLEESTISIPGKTMEKFIGNFQQLAKSEQGSATFRAQVETLPACFLKLAVSLNNNTVGSFLVEPGGWTQMTPWLGDELAEAAKPLLEIYDTTLKEGSVHERDLLGEQLINTFLIPILKKMK